MVCRTRPGGSASTSLAGQLSDLHTNEVLSLSHQLRHEGAGSPTPSREEVQQWATDLTELMDRAPGITPARRESIRGRIDQAAAGPLPDGREFYAWRHIADRAQIGSAALGAHLGQIATESGESEASVRARFDRLYREGNQRSNGLCAPPEWERAFAANADNGHIPTDRGTLYALRALRSELEPGHNRAEGVPLRRPLPGRVVRTAGYDRSRRRLDVHCAAGAGQGVVFSYEDVPESEYQRLAASAFADNVHDQIVERYRRSGMFTPGGHDDRQRCPRCGQYTGDSGHTCPEGTSTAAYDAPPDAVPVAGPSAIPAGDPLTDRMVMAETERVQASDFAVLLPRQDELRAFAAEHPEFDLDVQAQSGDGETFVEGPVRMVRDPRTGELLVEGANLTCSTDGTENCGHSQAVTEAVVAHANGRASGWTVANVEMAGREAQAAIVAENEAGTARLTRVRELNQQRDQLISLDRDRDTFAAVHQLTLERQRNGEPPVPFQPECAITGGAADPGGRGFGLEVEFVSGGSDTRREIGYQLRRAGLTRSEHQMPYHSTTRTPRTGRGLNQQAQGTWAGWKIRKSPGSFAELWQDCATSKADIGALKRAVVCFGHTRAASQGDIWKMANCSPMSVGSLIGTHNGDIDTPPVRGLSGGTDTERLYHLINMVGGDGLAAQVVLSRLAGRAALAWVDVTRPRRVFLARGALSPLVVATDRYGGLWWASNPAWFAQAGIPVIEQHHLDEGTWIELAVGPDRVSTVSTSDFIPLARAHDQLALHHTYTGWDRKDRAIDQARHRHQIRGVRRANLQQ